METARWKWLRFSLAALLFFTFCASGFLVGFRWGDYVRTEQERQIQPPPSPSYIRVYDVSDLVMQTGRDVGDDFDALLEEIRLVVTPAAWENGVAEIRPFETNLSILVTHTPPGHEAMDDYLQRKHGSTADSVASKSDH